MRPKAWKNDYEKEVVHIEEHACKAEAIPSGKDCQLPRRWMRRYRNSLSRGRSGPLSKGRAALSACGPVLPHGRECCKRKRAHPCVERAVTRGLYSLLTASTVCISAYVSLAEKRGRGTSAFLYRNCERVGVQSYKSVRRAYAAIEIQLSDQRYSLAIVWPRDGRRLYSACL